MLKTTKYHAPMWMSNSRGELIIMNKIVSVVIFAVDLTWTWMLMHSSQAIGFETHSGIQQRLAEMIRQTVITKKPNAKQFRISRLWTESMSDTKVRAVFAYEFTELIEVKTQNKRLKAKRFYSVSLKTKAILINGFFKVFVQLVMPLSSAKA